MKTIWKFEIGIDRGQWTVGMPDCAKVLSVQIQNDYGIEKVVLWAIVDPAKPEVPRSFVLYYTGDTLAPVPMNFIGTVQMDNGVLVVHVFEEVTEHTPTP